MVKFSFFALASALATVNAAASSSSSSGSRRVKKTIKLGNRNLRRGDPSTEALLQQARPYKNANTSNAAAASHRTRSRQLDENNFEIDGTYSLKFSQCVEVKTKDEDLFDDEIINYVQSGQVVAAKSYVLFHVCQDYTCDYDSEDDLYIVDLPTYLTNVAMYHANKRGDYCGACEEFEDYCTQEAVEEDAAEEEGDEAEEGDEDAADENEEGNEEDGDEDKEEGDENEEEGEQDEDNEEDKDENEEDNNENEGEEDNNEDEDDKDDRKLKKKNSRRKLNKAIERKLAKEEIDCDQCNSYECYIDEEDLDDNDINRNELDENVSAWIGELAECKESGVQSQTLNGLDLYIGAMCSPHGDGVELAVFANEDCTLYTNTDSFASVWDPYNDNEDGMNYLTYAESFIKSAFSEVTPCLEREFADPDEEENDGDEEENYEVNDYCQQVMEGDVADFNNCAADEDGEEEENDDQYNWYTYDLAEADDVGEVCYTLNQMAGEYSYTYDEELSGTWYERNSKGVILTGDEPTHWYDGIMSVQESMSTGAIAAIVATCLIVLVGAAFLCMKPKKNSDMNEPVYQGGTML